jgi:SAM-dependent methyltransferase
MTWSLEPWICCDRFGALEKARGCFDWIGLENGNLQVLGWMLLPDQPFDALRMYVNGEPQGPNEQSPLPHLGAAFPSIPHAQRCGFKFTIKPPAADAIQAGRITVLGYRGKQPIAVMDTLFRTDVDQSFPAPPAELLKRVWIQNAHVFRISGLKSFGEYAQAIFRHRDLRSFRRMLDWGCGCGRLTMNFMEVPRGPRVFGCDIDRQSIQWCSEHHPRGSFTAIDPWPPTPYEDNSFDLIVGYSVFTHLDREAQHAWLAEIKRLLVPGGMFVTSSHGEFAASFALAGGVSALQARGICDHTPDRTLDGVAPDGYYRSTFQTRAYTVREWSKHFDVLDYIERGAGNFQDLVVMQRAA